MRSKDHNPKCPKFQSPMYACECPPKVFDYSGKTDRELLIMTLEYLEDVEDVGPCSEGWKSDELKALINEIEERENSGSTSLCTL